MKPRIKKQTLQNASSNNDGIKSVAVTVSEKVEASILVPKEEPIVPIVTVSRMSEKDIADIQIERLRVVSMERQLTLEETRQLEIFTKIKLMIERPDRPIDVTPLPSTDKELLLIAATATSLEKKMENE